MRTGAEPLGGMRRGVMLERTLRGLPATRGNQVHRGFAAGGSRAGRHAAARDEILQWLGTRTDAGLGDAPGTACSKRGPGCVGAGAPITPRLI
ncbi:hypothetical protein GCM10011320_33250 [Neoroseomonas lacus]|uniref:Uncharacterized protein n=1 Tax=Neoroseomonas lacus TaxID=287609 RepID=A0A917KRN6_9PROT|nr:hypothetical protein GCM10011320_33250 [Neoroseomonas lacus]